MILEALQHLLLPCPRPLKRLGVLHGLIALQARARRCRAAWEPHLAAARAAALDGMAAAPGRGLAVVCGSGLLHDVPLAEMAARFDRVVLVDLFHMPAARRTAARFANVDLLAHDLSGVLVALAEGPETLPPPAASIPFAGKADFVLSANCLSQIPLAALGVVEGGQTWGRALVADHLRALRACAGTVALVTDVERVRTGLNGAVEERSDLLLGEPEPALEGRREWWWDLAPAPEAFRRSHLRHRAVAGRLLP